MMLRVARRPQRDVLVHDPRYYDFLTQHPELGSTKLIMRVYEALEAAGIPFYYSYPLGDSLATPGITERITVHFYIPTVNVAILVQGGFWFDDASRLQDTALMISLIEYAGIKCLWWTEPEIMSDGVDMLIAREPLLAGAVGTGGPMQGNYEPLHYMAYYTEPPHPFKRERLVARRKRRQAKR